MTNQSEQGTAGGANDGARETKTEDENKFEAAKKSLKRIGAEALLRKVAAIFPDTTVEIHDDFDQSRGTVFNPVVVITGPITETDLDRYDRTAEAVSKTEQMSLTVSSSTHITGAISLVVWKSIETTGSDNETSPSGHKFWDYRTWDYEKPEILTQQIFHGIEAMTPRMNGDLSAQVRGAMGIKSLDFDTANLARAQLK